MAGKCKVEEKAVRFASATYAIRPCSGQGLGQAAVLGLPTVNQAIFALSCKMGGRNNDTQKLSKINDFWKVYVFVMQYLYLTKCNAV